MSTRKPLLLTCLVGLFALATGCTLGPDPERPITAAHEAERFANATDNVVVDPASFTPWWRDFGDPVTVDLVEIALENNTDLRLAAARVLEAEALLAGARSSMWPTTSYSAGANRTKTSFVLPNVGRQSIFSTTFSTSLDVGYQVDLFGKLKRTRQQAWASLLAEQAAHDTVLHAVVAGVVRSRVALANAQRSLDITREIRSSWERTLATTERRYRNGLASSVDLYLARENLSAVRAAESQLEGVVATAAHALDVLLGRRPGSDGVISDTLADLPSLDPVPTGLPVALLDRRPDLQQAEAGLAAATYGVGLALADLYPDISLGGSIGTGSDTIENLFDVESVIYSAVASIAGPIFEGGRRRAQVDASRARVDQAVATYGGAVLTALQEVEDALALDRANQDRLEHALRRLDEARSADRVARDRYQRGVGTLLTVLETERRVRSAEEGLIAAKSDLWNTRIDLHLALGGDWSEHELLLDPSTTEANRALEDGSNAADETTQEVS
jgi:NodT family efflux transporter outer membrane factor (OMF) lipoprotein